MSAFLLFSFLAAPAPATRLVPQDRSFLAEWEASIGHDMGLGRAAASQSDTVFFGGSGSGNGAVVRGGVWDWEAASAEPPQFFPDGDPIGNEYRDGWTFEDRTARRGPSQLGAGHWRTTGVYDFNFDGGSFAHRATNHSNNGSNDGPDPLSEPGIGGSWSIWIGTNLLLNPEHCGWIQTRGYGDGWSQGTQKTYSIPAGSQGVQYAIRFFHRYAVEAGSDTNRVEISTNPSVLGWWQVGSQSAPIGIFTGGHAADPLPNLAGSAETVSLITWPTNNAGQLWVRFRLSSDALRSDASEGDDYLYGWQLDNIQLLRNGVPQEANAGFESGMDGWQPRPFEGFDFQVTWGPDHPAGRIAALSTLAYPPASACPGTCGLENRILMFADRDDCTLLESYQDSYAVSRAFAIGGPSQPDIDGYAGRLIQFDAYTDGGNGAFETGMAICWAYWPYDVGRCPYSPSAGDPGAGTTFNWSPATSSTCQYFSQGTGTECADDLIDDISAYIPASADSILLMIGAYSHCRSNPACDWNDRGTPFYDNVRFGVFQATTPVRVEALTRDRYADSFPTQNGSLLTTTARMDGAHSATQELGLEYFPRWVRSDSAVARCSEPNTAMYLRFRVTPGRCQPLNSAFFIAFHPNQWHAARMDTARAHFTGINVPGSYMTCFHESDPRNGTHWTGPPPSYEPCDDILPDGLFMAGTSVEYFFEARNASSGAVTGTFPRTPYGALGTGPEFSRYWLRSDVLPPLHPACTGEQANDVLVVNDYHTASVPGLGTIHRDRLAATLMSLGLSFDVYDVTGTDFTTSFDGIGRREDLPMQQPRPPFNGATQLQLEPFDCIWYSSGLDESATLRDKTTAHPSQDQQTLEAWLENCSPGQNRLLVLDGLGWASDIDGNTSRGPSFLLRLGVDVLSSDYAQQLANNDLRRCARIMGTGPWGPNRTGAAFGSGCPEDLPLDVFSAVNGGQALAQFVESNEGEFDPVNCADDIQRPQWHVAIRKADPVEPCERSAAMGFPFAFFYPLDCVDECAFSDFALAGPQADLATSLFIWAGQPVGTNQPPVCDPGGPYVTFAGVRLVLNGTGSFDPDGSIAAWEWDFGDGMGSGPTPFHIYSSPGIYTVTLTVIDNLGLSASCQTTATVGPNSIPVCDAGGPYLSFPGAALQLDGTGSSDPDGAIVSYSWSFGDGATGTGATPSHTYGTIGDYTAELTVTDDRGAPSTCESTVTVYHPIDADVSISPPLLADRCGILRTFTVWIDSVEALAGYNVRIRYDETAATNAGPPLFGVTEGGFLPSAGTTTFFVVRDAPGDYVISSFLLAPTQGATGAGALFTLSLTASREGTVDLTLSDLLLRDPQNMPIPGVVAGGSTWSIDCTPPCVTALLEDDPDECWPGAPEVRVAASDTGPGADLDRFEYQYRAGVDACDPMAPWLLLAGNLSGPSCAPCGPYTPGTSPPLGTHTLYVRAVDDVGNVTATCTCVGSYTFTRSQAQNPPAGIVTDLTATPGHERVNLSWTNPALGLGDEIRIVRKSWRGLAGSGYPHYNSDGPAGGEYPTSLTDGTVVYVGTGGSFVDMIAERDIYLYRGFVANCLGSNAGAGAGQAPENPETPTDATDAATNYLLADVDSTFGLPPGPPYNGRVNGVDLVVFSSAFGTDQGEPGFEPQVDFGPTLMPPFSGRGVPVPDNRINFEDLAVLAVNYGTVLGSASSIVLGPPGNDPQLGVSLGPPVRIAADRTEWPLVLLGNEAEVKALRVQLSYDDERVKFVAARVADRIAAGQVPHFFAALESHAAVEAHLAVLGEGLVVHGSGAVAHLIFRHSAKGELAGVRIAAVELRDRHNLPIGLGMSGEPNEQAAKRPLVAANRLHLAQPNPFNPMTRIGLDLMEGGHIRLQIYDIGGRAVRNLLDGPLPAGTHWVTWDGRDAETRPAPSGVYFVEMEIGHARYSHRLVLLR